MTPLPPIARRVLLVSVLPFGTAAALFAWIAADQAAFVWRVMRGR